MSIYEYKYNIYGSHNRGNQRITNHILNGHCN